MIWRLLMLRYGVRSVRLACAAAAVREAGLTDPIRHDARSYLVSIMLANSARVKKRPERTFLAAFASRASSQKSACIIYVTEFESREHCLPPVDVQEEQQQQDYEDEDLTCAVCQDVLCEPVKMPCSHVFDRYCIATWIQRSESCPLCKAYLPLHSVRIRCVGRRLALLVKRTGTSE